MTVADSERWQTQALCRGMDPALFFPERGHHDDDCRAALAVCAECPVTTQCLEENLHESDGVWGGTTGRQRRVIRRERRLDGTLPVREKPRPACGTDAGHRAHLRRHEQSCIACKEAHTAKQRSRDQRVDPQWRVQCGSNAGYLAHFRATPRERPCQACMTAHAHYQRQQTA